MEENELYDVVNWLNANYNQETENYCIFFGAKPGVIEYNDHIAISPWACGAIVCINDILFFIEEDDGYWWVNKEEKEFGRSGWQCGFSIGWVDSFVEALNALKKYAEEHGNPVYFSGSDTICHYKLGKVE